MEKFKNFYSSKKKRKKAPVIDNQNLDNNTNPTKKGIYLNPPYGTEGRALTPHTGSF